MLSNLNKIYFRVKKKTEHLIQTQSILELNFGFHLNFFVR